MIGKKTNVPEKAQNEQLVNPYIDNSNEQPVNPYIDNSNGQPVNPYIDNSNEQPVNPYIDNSNGQLVNPYIDNSYEVGIQDIQPVSTHPLDWTKEVEERGHLGRRLYKIHTSFLKVLLKLMVQKTTKRFYRF